MKRHLRFFITVFLALAVVLLALINWQLYYSPQIRIIKGDTVKYDALCQLRHLRDAIVERDAANEMQGLYPEGYIFFNALYGLSWCDFASSLDSNNDILYHEAHLEIQRALSNINSDEARIIFDKGLPLPYGAFYNGWLTYLLAKKLKLEDPGTRNASEIRLFKTQCALIASVIEKQVYPETYYGSSWPADVVVCVGALAMHDKLFGPTYQTIIQRWWRKANKNLDPSGLIPHRAHSISGKPVENARGSSQSLMQCFLPELTAKNHGFETYRNNFFETRFGLPGVREYPKGIDGDGDIDSGPVILGMGGAATVVGIRALSTHGLKSESIELRNSVEALALPVMMDGRKKYLLGKLPIADVFITWAQAGAAPENEQKKSAYNWRLCFQLWSGAIIIASMTIILMWWRKKP